MISISDRCAGHDNNFNLIRLLAAVGVLVSHAYPVTDGDYHREPVALLLNGMGLGGLGVMLFFAVSGFFIARSFESAPNPLSFLVARFLRIMPALVVMLLVCALVGSFISTAAPRDYWAAVPRYIYSNASLSMFWHSRALPGVFENNPYEPDTNASLWTLEFEVYFYLCVAAIGSLGILRNPRRFAASVAGMLLAYGGMVYSSDSNRFVQLSFPFIIGMCFWVWRDHVRLSWVYALGLVALTALLLPTKLFLPMLTICVAYGAFVLGYARLPLLARFNRGADWSYGTYIYAFPIQQAFASAGVLTVWGNIALSLPVTLACAALSWSLVEKPALRLKRGFAAGPAAVA
ncbi:acyltransferase family protein [Paragemmobacter straminiformis]|uniref:Acyltransferase n=1 Tax=Paragemmobacter straminiformis TaxID=2045119 RepID=A0A842I5Y1_9RHOB|nr:acyltransferase [Gemmobacter straminiformis]MBC2834358.1 acyltransferase [Gemmobacter straminiformis]